MVTQRSQSERDYPRPATPQFALWSVIGENWGDEVALGDCSGDSFLELRTPAPATTIRSSATAAAQVSITVQQP